MISYLSTKAEFVQSCYDGLVEKIVLEKYECAFGRRPALNEESSWKSSLGDAVFKVLSNPRYQLPDDLGIAVEYGVHGSTRPKRVDLMISGHGHDGVPTICIIELKQWSEAEHSDEPDRIIAQIAAKVHTSALHPSLQAANYANVIEDFYSYCQENHVRIKSCSFLHNLTSPDVVRAEKFGFLSTSPTFIANERDEFAQYLSDTFATGDSGRLIELLDESTYRPSQPLMYALGEMLEGNKVFELSSEQQAALDEIVSSVRRGRDEKSVVLIQGGPGTGKSVIAINALVQFIRDDARNAIYVTKNAAPRTVYRELLRGRPDAKQIWPLFRSSDGFAVVEKESFDLIIVDEAHRLVPVGSRDRAHGKDQIVEILNASKNVVFFVDDSQQITYSDFGTSDKIREICTSMGITPIEFNLTVQFRCHGGKDYLDWVEGMLGLRNYSSPVDLSETTYEVRVFDDPNEMVREIRALDDSNQNCRTLAGYCWDWVSKKDPAAYDVELPEHDFKMRWNDFAAGQQWLLTPNSVNELGCVYTMQGLEGDYMGVILGPNVTIQDGQLVTRPLEQAKTDNLAFLGSSIRTTKDPSVLARVDFLIRNQYRVLLTRGAKGTFIFATNPEVREYIRDCLQESNY